MLSFSIGYDTNACTETALQERVLNFRFEIADIKLGLIAQLPKSTEIGSQAAFGKAGSFSSPPCNLFLRLSGFVNFSVVS